MKVNEKKISMAEKMYRQNTKGGVGASPKYAQSGKGTGKGGGMGYRENGIGTGKSGGQGYAQANKKWSFIGKYNQG